MKAYRVSWIYLDMRDVARYAEKPRPFRYLTEAESAVVSIQQDPGVISVMIDEVTMEEPDKVIGPVYHKAFPERCLSD